MEQRTLVIDREQWGRGDPSTSFLLSKQSGKMCCLGFYALQLAGATRADIENEGVPSTHRLAHLPWGGALLGRTSFGALAMTGLCTDLVAANDSPQLSDTLRERLITILFAKMHVDVQFVGGDHA